MLDLPDIILPDTELNALVMAALHAVGLAQAGRFADGYDCLSAGLERALRTAEEGEPWGPALADRWSHTLQSYCRRFGVFDSQAE